MFIVAFAADGGTDMNRLPGSDKRHKIIGEGLAFI
jgi:hypothetical protein